MLKIDATSPIPDPRLPQGDKEVCTGMATGLSRTYRDIVARPMSTQGLESAEHRQGVSPPTRPLLTQSEVTS